jgi:glycosyltransferase involved in cell wall biosynthesis
MFMPVNNQLGYGIHGYNLLKAYYKNCSKEIALLPINGQKYIQGDEVVDECIKNQEKTSSENPSICIWHEHDMMRFTGSPRIGFPVFEMEKLDEKSINQLKQLDYVLVPSEWQKSVLVKYGISCLNIHVIPEGFDPEIFYPEYSKEYKLERLKEKITFITVGKYESRKSSKLVLELFCQLLPYFNKKIELIAHMFNLFYPNWIHDVEETLMKFGLKKFGSNRWVRGNLTIIVPEAPIESSEGVSVLMKKAHFGIYLSKAEGWNLPLIETLACGTPCLTTNTTGQSEYLEAYKSDIIIKSYHKEIANDGIWFKGDRGIWRVPDEKEIVQKLMNIVKNPEKYLEYDYSKYLKDNFTWKHSALKLKEFLDGI